MCMSVCVVRVRVCIRLCVCENLYLSMRRVNSVIQTPLFSGNIKVFR